MVWEKWDVQHKRRQGSRADLQRRRVEVLILPVPLIRRAPVGASHVN